MNNQQKTNLIDYQLFKTGSLYSISQQTVNSTLEFVLETNIQKIKQQKMFFDPIIKLIYDNMDMLSNDEIIKNNIQKYIIRQEFLPIIKNDHYQSYNFEFYSFQELINIYKKNIDDILNLIQKNVDFDINLLSTQIFGFNDFVFFLGPDYKIILFEFLKDFLTATYKKYELLFSYKILIEYLSYSFHKWMTDIIILGDYGYDEHDVAIWWEGSIRKDYVVLNEIENIFPLKWILYSKSYKTI